MKGCEGMIEILRKSGGKMWIGRRRMLRVVVLDRRMMIMMMMMMMTWGGEGVRPTRGESNGI